MVPRYPFGSDGPLFLSWAVKLNTPHIPHQHEFEEIVLVLEGLLVQEINGIRVVAEEGDVFVLGGDDVHALSACTNLSLLNIGYRESQLAPYREGLSSLAGFHALFTVEPRLGRSQGARVGMQVAPVEWPEVKALAWRLVSEDTQRSSGWQVALLALFGEMLVTLSRHVQPRTGSSVSSSALPLASTVEAMERRYAQPLRLETLATLAGQSVSAYLGNFKKCFGLPPMQYLLRLRVRKACRLLAQTDASITRIAFETGFQDSNYFSRAFAKVVGCSPRAYRNQTAPAPPLPRSGRTPRPDSPRRG
jgi:AraC-like DNA-binding protein